MSVVSYIGNAFHLIEPICDHFIWLLGAKNDLNSV